MEGFNAVCTIIKTETFRSFILLAGVVVAIVSVWMARITARKKQTADLIFGVLSNNELIAGLRRVKKAHKAGHAHIRSLAKKGHLDSPDSLSIRHALNHYEHVAVGIQAGIYDERMLRKNSYHTVITLHERASPFIDALRNEIGVPTLYQELRWLAQKWKKKPLEKKQQA